MQYVAIGKERFSQFIEILAHSKPVYAPVSKGFDNYVFERVSSADKIALQYIPTILPPKKYFLPPRETIINFDLKRNCYEGVLEFESMYLFGVHTCDLAGIQYLDIVLSDKPKDINYISRKGKIFIIGLECNQYCDEYASCALMNNHLPNGGYDLFFTDLGDAFIVHVHTERGESLVKKTGLFSEAGAAILKKLEALREQKKRIFSNEVNIRRDKLAGLFESGYNSPVWNDLDRRCVACGNCTNVCPTCYCFDILEDISFDGTEGSRIRMWDSCQNEGFAKIASGENFRKARGDRQRHRYRRKFLYSFQKYGRYSCTGCGRCTRSCMAKISLKETINALASEQEEKNEKSATG
jgi:sulfhydrogenase subunit beta (sulfur reductase)